MSTFNHQSRTTKKKNRKADNKADKICLRKFKKRQENPQTIFLNESQSDYFLNINSKFNLKNKARNILQIPKKGKIYFLHYEKLQENWQR